MALVGQDGILRPIGNRPFGVETSLDTARTSAYAT